MSGLLDGLLGSGAADNALAQAYGLTPDMLAAQRMNSLGQIGGILLAASQAGPTGQRGQMLGQLAQVPGDASRGMLNAAQARLAGSKVREAQEDEARRAKVREMIATMPNLSDADKAWATSDPAGFLSARGTSMLGTTEAVRREQALGPIRTQQEVARRQALDPLDVAKQAQTSAQSADATFNAKVKQLTASGMSEEMARGIAGGRYVVRNEDGQVGVFDITTGQPVGGPRPSLNDAQEKIVSGMPTKGADGKPIDYSEATGGAGLVKHGANLVAGALGAKPFADQDTTRNALEGLRTRTMTQLTAAIPGRETNAMRDQLSGLAVQPGDILMPDTMAITKFHDTKALIDGELSKLNAQLNAGGLTGAQRGQVRQNIAQLKTLSQDYGIVIEHFGKQAAPAAPAGGAGGGADFKVLGVR